MTRFQGFSDEEYLAEGGLGYVWRATRSSTGGVVAIKEIKQLDVGSPAWHRARREVEALVRLKGHPHVVSVEEIMDGPDGPALVMEYLDSGSLADGLKHGPLPLERLVQVGSGILSAIEAAHAVGIIHRDLKPQNVLLGRFGQVKVCDFGISAIARDGAHTQTAASTLGYASPEEIDGSVVVGPPADVYSFCVTMVHVITGTRPSFAERLSGRVGFSDAFVAQFPGLASLLLQGMAIEADDRPTIGELSRAFNLATRSANTTASTAVADATVVRPSAAAIEPKDAAPAGARSRSNADATPFRTTPSKSNVTVHGVKPSGGDALDNTVLRPSARTATATSVPRKRFGQTRILVATSVVVVLALVLGAVISSRQDGGSQGPSVASDGQDLPPDTTDAPASTTDPAGTDSTTAGPTETPPDPLAEPARRKVLSIRAAGQAPAPLSNALSDQPGGTVAKFLDHYDISNWFPDVQVPGGLRSVGLHGAPEERAVSVNFVLSSVPKDLLAAVMDIARQVEHHLAQSVPGTEFSRDESSFSGSASVRSRVRTRHAFDHILVNAVTNGRNVYVSVTMWGLLDDGPAPEEVRPCRDIYSSSVMVPFGWSLGHDGMVECMLNFEGTPAEAEQILLDHYGPAIVTSDRKGDSEYSWITMALDPAAISPRISGPVTVEMDGSLFATVWFKWQS